MSVLLAAALLVLAAPPTPRATAADAGAAPPADDEQTTVEIAKLHERLDTLRAGLQSTQSELQATQAGLESAQASADGAQAELERRDTVERQVQGSRETQRRLLSSAGEALRVAYGTVAQGTPDLDALQAAQASFEEIAARAQGTAGDRTAGAAVGAAANVSLARAALAQRNYLDAQVFLTRALGGASEAQSALAALPR